MAAVGSETINPDTMQRFASALAPTGFSKKALVVGYGMAECSLAVSFSHPGQGLAVEHLDADLLSSERRAIPAAPGENKGVYTLKNSVSCGQPMPEYEIQVRDSRGRLLPERHVGTLFVRGPSVMSGYFGDARATAEVLADDGWLNTGDLAYVADNQIFITGREKDLLNVNDRSVWPQDLENIAEQQPEVRTGDAAAIAVPAEDGIDRIVLLLQSRNPEKATQSGLTVRIQRLILREIGIDCEIELVPRHTLPRTTSGKLARARARQEYLDRMARTVKIVQSVGA
jgi:fatty-acyl-CoA synthase